MKTRIATDRANDIFIAHRANGAIAIEQGYSHVLLDQRELRLLLAALHECVAEDFQPNLPRIQRFVNGIEQY